MIHLDYRDARPIYAQILDGFKAQIRSGVLQAGDKMPSVRELAASLAINPNTIQRAYHDLEQGGFIASVPGKGSFVCELPKPAETDQQNLLESFDQTTTALLALGLSKEELILRIIQKGGK